MPQLDPKPSPSPFQFICAQIVEHPPKNWQPYPDYSQAIDAAKQIANRDDVNIFVMLVVEVVRPDYEVWLKNRLPKPILEKGTPDDNRT